MKYERSLLSKLYNRIREPRKFIQVLSGPRQVGKTTIVLSLKEKIKEAAEYHSADDSVDYGYTWIDQIWESLRIKMDVNDQNEAILILDEVQKISDWSSAVKKNWDRDSREDRNIKLILTGSSRLLIMDGLSESLMGRYEFSYAGHWSLAEMEEAFGFSPEQYQWFGGYPGAASLVNDEIRFKEYILNSIIEPTMVRDILMTTKIDKPALLRQLLEVGIGYSGQIISYNKMLGQLQDAGNTTTLSKYMKLLDQAGLLSGLNKYNGRLIEKKNSRPKLQVQNSALFSALSETTFENIIQSPIEWGRIFENSVGSYLVNEVNKHPNISLYYWRENNMEVDYVIVSGDQILGLEIKSGDNSIPQKVTIKFKERFPDSKLLLIGKHGIPYNDFMKTDLTDLITAAL